MAKGKKYPDDIKEKVFLMYATSGNKSEVAKSLNLPFSTVSNWIDNKKPDKFDKLRDEKKADFIEQASSIIDKAMSLLDRRVTTALEKEEELAVLMDEIFVDPDMAASAKKALISKISSLQLQSMRDVTTAVGTLYDKRALAKGESTENTNISITLPEGFDKYAG